MNGWSVTSWIIGKIGGEGKKCIILCNSLETKGRFSNPFSWCLKSISLHTIQEKDLRRSCTLKFYLFSSSWIFKNYSLVLKYN